nr:hypothetical protein [Desulfobacula sp.]
MIKLVAVSSSPVKNGNSEHLTSHMIEMALQNGCTAECFYLSDMKIGECLHCNPCISKQKVGKYCVQGDDAQKIFKAAEKAGYRALP